MCPVSDLVSAVDEEFSSGMPLSSVLPMGTSMACSGEVGYEASGSSVYALYHTVDVEHLFVAALTSDVSCDVICSATFCDGPEPFAVVACV